MIVVRFTGGLGNQMFEYAVYFKLKKLFPEEKIYADIIRYDMDNEHDGFDIIKYFELEIDFLEDEYLKEIAILNYFGKKLHIEKILRFFSCSKIEKINAIFEKMNNSIEIISDYASTNYNENIYCLNYDATKIWHYKGNWINPCYWNGYEKNIINSFKFRENILSIQDNQLIKNMLSEESVAIHIRSGDYIGKYMFDLCKETYYKKAINMIKKLCGNRKLKFYIFSENLPEWELLKSFDYTFVLHEEKPGTDMWLMSKCKHNIIANSTFSYWSAILNKNEEKIVISPMYAYRKNMYIKFPVPEQWIQIDNLK